MSSIAVRIPRVVMVDRTRSLLAGEVAVLARLGDMVRAMHGSRRDRYGHPGDRVGGTDPVAQLMLRRALGHVAGPLRLLGGDFPDRPVMLEIVDQNIGRTLAQLP
ncbi:hypothetical protein [Amycolatopsis kentuckyensis]|uniref:hypothetical protein n=1 Tax=Amycolatopsis kentuckyensis TaxID=218823 RepID=UPI001FCA3D9C|nr:hypothetical protein [Amycolatopsis kentuckyensis]